MVVADEEGAVHLGKALTTRDRAFKGIDAALQTVAGNLNTTVESLLKRADVFNYGTTRATNAIVEHATARTAFFTTEGFPDILLMREGGKPHPFKQMTFPPPYVPRHLTYEISERIDADGSVHLKLDEESVLCAIEAARSAGCEAVGVCLLWSTVNSRHEARVGELIKAQWPDAAVTLSYQLNPVVREYRRASSAVIDASLKPLMQSYLATMEEDLRASGFNGHLLIATSYGGAWKREQITDKPIYTIGSGPSMAPVAAKTYARSELSAGAGGRDVIVCDTGGTTFDVGLVRDGEIQTTPENWLGGRWIGHITGIRSVDVKSIGAGGGSIARVDPGGLLHVGPDSAGADPGPACYGRGGTLPTVTDAAVVLGYIDPAYFLGGQLTLDQDAAERAVWTQIAEPLGMELAKAASAILVIATENIVGAIRELTIAQGIDPREVTMVAGGGAAGLNVVTIAKELGCRNVLVPSTAGALSACGALYADLVSEFTVSGFMDSDSLDHSTANGALVEAEKYAEGFFSGFEGMALAGTQMQYLVEARYPMQVWELEVDLPIRRLETQADVEAMEEAFHVTHERVFAVREPGQSIECINWKVRARAQRETPPLRARPVEPNVQMETGSNGQAYFAESGWLETPRYSGANLKPNDVIEGPAIVLEPTTTLVVNPNSKVRVTGLGNYIIELGISSDAGKGGFS